MKRKRDIFLIPGESGFVEPSTPGVVLPGQPASGNPFDIIQPVARPVDGASLFNPISAVLLLDAVKKPTRLLSARKSDRLSSRIAVPTPTPVVPPTPAGLQVLASDSFAGMSYPDNVQSRSWDNALEGDIAVAFTGVTSNSWIRNEYSVDARLDSTTTPDNPAITDFNYAIAGVANDGDGCGMQSLTTLQISSSHFKIQSRYVDGGNKLEVQFKVGEKPKVYGWLASTQLIATTISDFVGLGLEATAVEYYAYVLDTDTGVRVVVGQGAEEFYLDIANTGFQVANIAASPSLITSQYNFGRVSWTWCDNMKIIQYA